jgi:hypothetical protein
VEWQWKLQFVVCAVGAVRHTLQTETFIATALQQF